MSESAALKCGCFSGQIAVSVVKAGQVQDGAATSCVQREISVFYATNGPFWQIDLLPFCLSVSFEEMILPRLKSSILQVKLPLESISKKTLYSWLVNLPHTDKISTQSFLRKI